LAGIEMKKQIILCGGSKGIGASIFKLLSENNYDVYCISRTIGELENFENINHIPCDLASAESREIALKKLSSLTNIWGLINNCSGPNTGSCIESTNEEYLRSINSHLFASNEFANFVIPKMKELGGGRIINIISVTAKIPLANMVVSNTVRGAMLNWSKTLSKEIGKFNITVNNVLPGYTETDRLKEVIKGVSTKQNLSEIEYSNKIKSEIPLNRFGKPEEIAFLVEFLISIRSSFINGASIPIDGGWTACS
jgi:3-oxoacyl-[acyl-carrier protein] reductase